MSEVFVFGSNEAGRHGKGAAKYALKHYGAVYGQGVGRQGNSYAIPTKDEDLSTLGLKAIRTYFIWFVNYTKDHLDDTFLLTPIGCGLAGYTKDQILNEVIRGIAIPNNVIFTKEWG